MLDLKSILGGHYFPPPRPRAFNVESISDSFAYVDFATQDAKLAAITLSERNLEGRRLLIKDGVYPQTLSPLYH